MVRRVAERRVVRLGPRTDPPLDRESGEHLTFPRLPSARCPQVRSRGR
jgi:hypothetical protein